MAFDSAAGWCPFAIRKSAHTNNFTPANDSGFGRVAFDAVVEHITEGPRGDEYASAIRWFQNPASQVSAHFVISPTGQITQCVSIYDVAYSNGLSFHNGAWSNPRGKVVTPRWTGLRPGVNPNRTTISIEHAGQHGDLWPQAMTLADSKLLQWLASVIPSFRPYVAGQNLIGHNMLDPLDRANCPGPHVSLPALAALANMSPAPSDTGPDIPYFVDRQPITMERLTGLFTSRKSPIEPFEIARLWDRLLEDNINAALFMAHWHAEDANWQWKSAGGKYFNPFNIRARADMPSADGWLDFTGGPNGGGGLWLGLDFTIFWLKWRYGAQELYTIDQIGPVWLGEPAGSPAANRYVGGIKTTYRAIVG